MWLLVILGVIIHLILFYSIFDIYFTSPLVHGMSPVTPPTTPPAKRLVLFVADGLRADKFFGLKEDGSSYAPYLRTKIEKDGAWGVSHTHMPTESRPGHVAMIAGFYEDVSAVAKGWKENPVEFDSVFNESRYTWSWGSPDILPMFAKGAKGGNVMMDCYSGQAEDFASSKSSNLDTWVFDKFENLLQSAATNTTLNEMLHQDRIIFFFHLLGIDVNGHSHKPHSHEYLENIGIVDEGIKKMVGLIDDFYGKDDATAYIMTSDHGMTNWGSHGAGLPDETVTPLVVWGRGVRSMLPTDRNTPHYTDTYSQDWELENVKRVDVQQADIAPLMASLIGTTYPLNSVGTLPIDYLDATDSFKAHNLLTNAEQILNQFQVKMAQKQATTFKLLFRQYAPLTASHQAHHYRTIRQYINDHNFTQAIKESKALIRLALDGLTYYHTYDRFFLGMCITLTYLGWITICISFLLSQYSQPMAETSHIDARTAVSWFSGTTDARTAHGSWFSSTVDARTAVPWFSSTALTVFSGVVGAVVTTIMLVQESPLTHIVYAMSAVCMWCFACYTISPIVIVLNHLHNTGQLMNTLGVVVSFLCGVELLVKAFFWRGHLSLGLLLLSTITTATLRKRVTPTILYLWVLSTMLLAVFPLLPVVGRESNYSLVIAAGVVIIALSLLTINYSSEGNSGNLPKLLQCLLMVLTVYIVKTTSASISAKTGLPMFNQIGSWFILVTSMTLPLLSKTLVTNRLVAIQLSFAAPYLLLSIAHEGLFLITLCVVLLLWLSIEHCVSLKEPNAKYLTLLNYVGMECDTDHLRTGERRYVTTSDLRISYFFVLLILTSFFGTGNIASINSFDPTMVYCFITVFSPFVMGALLLWKNIIPIVLVMCTFHAIHISTRLPTRAFFFIVLIISDLMALNLVFLIRDTGSWLDIGTSISHYVIVMSLIIFFMGLHGVTYGLTRWRLSVVSDSPKCPSKKQHLW